jgi:hypothetical protein
VSQGHDASWAWKRTPKQLQAWTQLSARRKLGEQAELMLLMRAAHHAEDKDFRGQLRKMQEEAQ